MPMRPKQRPAPMSETTANDYRKILAFASSAGKTISGADALEVIRSICLERLAGDRRAAAIVRHAERVDELMRNGNPWPASELLEEIARG